MFRQISGLFSKQAGGKPLGRVGDVLNLHQAPCGGRFKICQLCGNANNCQKLREMGFTEDTEIQVLSRNGAVVCQVFGSRVGLSSSLARNVMVSRSIS